MDRSFVFLLAGQSNMSGRGDARSVPPLRDERILVSRAGELEVASEPLHTDTDAGIGPGMSFATRTVRAGLCDRLILVPCAVGGTWIDRWVPGADLFDVAAQEARAATRHGVLAGILWHQGEANAASTGAAASYAGQFRQVIQGFREEYGKQSLPFIAGEIGEFLYGYPGCPAYEMVNRAIHDVCRELPACAVASSEGLNHVGDFLHFDAMGARTLGIRYAEAWMEVATL